MELDRLNTAFEDIGILLPSTDACESLHLNLASSSVTSYAYAQRSLSHTSNVSDMSVTLQLPGTEILWRSYGPPLLAQIERERHVLARIAHGHPLSDALQELLGEVEASAKSRMLTSILQLSDDGQRLHHLAAPSLPAAYIAAINGVTIGEGVGSCGTVIHRGTPVYVSDIATDPLWIDYCGLALENGLRACWSTPIKGIDGTTLGTFAIYYDAPRAPTPQDIESIAAITLIVALAIERHRADLHLQQMRDELTALRGDLDR
jgi:GAF domain-containing protein